MRHLAVSSRGTAAVPARQRPMTTKMTKMNPASFVALGASGRPAANKTAVVANAATFGGQSDAVSFPENTLSLSELKSLLEDTLGGTQRGLSANSDTRAEILDLVSQLEAKTPIASPNQSGLNQLAGTWKLVYTSNSELLPVLALGKLPLVEVGEITQTIDAGSGKVENVVQLSVPFSKTSVGSTANFDVRSPKLLEIEFTDGRISTPELMSDFELPDSVEVAGQQVDLSGLKALLKPLDSPVRGLIEQAGTFLAGQQDFEFKTDALSNMLGGQDGRVKRKATWLLNTYLDEDLRIARGDGGSLFVMKKNPVLELPDRLDMTIDEVDIGGVDKVGPLSDGPAAVQPVDIAVETTEVKNEPEPEPFFPSNVKTELDELCEDDPSADECRVYED